MNAATRHTPDRWDTPPTNIHPGWWVSWPTHPRPNIDWDDGVAVLGLVAETHSWLKMNGLRCGINIDYVAELDDTDVDTVACELEMFAYVGDVAEEAYIETMNLLYDWADRERVWIRPT